MKGEWSQSADARATNGFNEPCKTVDPRLDKNEAVLAVLVFPVDLEMLTDGDGLLDQMPQILRNTGSKTYTNSGSEYSNMKRRRGELTLGLEDTEDLVAGDELDLRDAVAVAEGDTDLRRGKTLTGQLADLVNNILGGGLKPRRRSAAVWEGGGS